VGEKGESTSKEKKKKKEEGGGNHRVHVVIAGTRIEINGEKKSKRKSGV